MPFLLAAALLGGCAGPKDAFPSLARRPFEQSPVITPAPPAARAVASGLPGAVGGKVDALRARHQNASSDFLRMLPAVRLAVQLSAQGGAAAEQGSENWVTAQLMISRLDNARSDAIAALADMDDLIMRQLDAESADETPLISPLLGPIRADMAAAVERQNQEIAALTE